MTAMIIILAEKLVNALCELRELSESDIPHETNILRLCLLYHLTSPSLSFFNKLSLVFLKSLFAHLY